MSYGSKKLIEDSCHRAGGKNMEKGRVNLNKLPGGRAGWERKQLGIRLCRELAGASRVFTEKAQLKFL